ncbi:hypothetical protein THTE_1985 [Thermogutta terrifontis]|uniref:Uncharacterized protein n=1 Tax=Thermogutta terrifontis TaxID=1331910 RepID=A0A286RF69_9BACT|nr:hypothetical protein THTE_1985 [Thermogutta terrifontis]
MLHFSDYKPVRDIEVLTRYEEATAGKLRTHVKGVRLGE